MNTALLNATLSYIEEHPDQHRQDVWRCGTGQCFAGWAATLSGVRWTNPDPDSGDAYLVTVPRLVADALAIAVYEARQQDEFTLDLPVRVYARAALGLDVEQAARLFAGENQLVQLQDYVQRLVDDPNDDLSIAEVEPDVDECRCANGCVCND